MRKNSLMTLRNRIRKSSCSVSSKLAAAACVVLGMAVLLCPTDQSVTRAESAPDWMTSAGHVDLAHFGDGSAAVILGQWTDFSVDANGKFVSTERSVMRVLNRRAAERYLQAVGFENN